MIEYGYNLFRKLDNDMENRRMKILVAMDSYKGCFTSVEAGKAVRDGILWSDPETEIIVCPLADGGEGTMYALCGNQTAEIMDLTVTGPLGEPVRGQYGILNENIAVIEIASAAGLPLIPKEKRDPLLTTTYGVGEMIRDGISRGCRDFIIGLGGSGTNDGGVGMLRALGWKFLDRQGRPISHGGIGLRDLVSISDEEVLPELLRCRFRIACDVTNPLFGENGCSAIFAPQKGADPGAVADMDRWMEAYSRLVKAHYPTADPSAPGSGAAGGLGFAFSVFLQGKMESGARIVGEYLEIEDKIRQCDLVITGEGCLDGQSSMGKGPMYIARMGKQYGKPVIALVGAIGSGAEKSLEEGMTAYFSIQPYPMSLSEAMMPEKAYLNLKNTATQVLNLYKTQNQSL